MLSIDSTQEYEMFFGTVKSPIDRIIEEVEEVEYPQTDDGLDELVIGEQEEIAQ